MSLFRKLSLLSIFSFLLLITFIALPQKSLAYSTATVGSACSSAQASYKFCSKTYDAVLICGKKTGRSNYIWKLAEYCSNGCNPNDSNPRYPSCRDYPTSSNCADIGATGNLACSSDNKILQCHQVIGGYKWEAINNCSQNNNDNTCQTTSTDGSKYTTQCKPKSPCTVQQNDGSYLERGVCGKNNDSDTLYNCAATAQRAVGITHCIEGCHVSKGCYDYCNEDGAPSPACPPTGPCATKIKVGSVYKYVSGKYCPAEGKALYSCKGDGTGSAISPACANGCHINPPGSEDSCKSAPAPTPVCKDGNGTTPSSCGGNPSYKCTTTTHCEESTYRCDGDACVSKAYRGVNVSLCPKGDICNKSDTNKTTLSFVVGLDGIGTTGDQVNPTWNKVNGQAQSGSTLTPIHTTRSITVTLINNDGVTKTFTGDVVYDSNNAHTTTYGKFVASQIDLGNTANGTYKVYAKVPGYLTKSLGSVSIVSARDQSLSGSNNLITGNITGGSNGTADNRLTIEDYNVLVSCSIYSKDQTVCHSNPNLAALSDLDDNGTATTPLVNQFDFNLFLREFSKVQTGDKPPTSLDANMKIDFNLYPQHLALLKDPNLWRNKLNSAYHALENLTGKTPFNGHVITYKEVPAASLENGTAACLSGQTIKCRDIGYPGVIDGVNTHNELGFGEIHELGHDFDLELDSADYLHGNADLINVEQWANLKLTYVADALATKYPDTTLFQDRVGFVALADFSKKYFTDIFSAEWLSSSKSDWTKMNGDAYTGLLHSLAAKYGWDTFKKTFIEFNTFRSAGKAVPATDLGKIQLFVDTLSKNAPAGNDIKTQFKSWGIPIR